jgi:glucose-6-phosphate dehydrogenase assembly protein OpcA
VTGRQWRASAPEAIEADLAALWRDVTKDGPVARAMMSNLVIVRTPRHAWPEQRIGVSIDAVAAQHPSRVVIIDHESTASAAGHAAIARVGVVTFGPPEARYGVEQIAVRSAGLDEALPSLVRRFVRGDLPISIWWAEDLSEAPLIAPILQMGRQLVYDSGRWQDVARGVTVLQDWRHLDLADVNWRRIAAMRRALIFAAGAAPPGGWSPSAIRITHRPDDRAQAWLLAGWLASRLGAPGSALPRREEATDSLLTVTIGEGDEAMRVERADRRVLVRHGGRPPSVIGVPVEGEADVIAAELHTLSRDVRLHEVIGVLARGLAPGHPAPRT